jgi:uncharacterized membrane protein YeiH
VLTGQFQLHLAFDLAATFLFAGTGALAAVRKRYDIVGIMVLAFVTGLGGALIRDTLLQKGTPPFLEDARYLIAVIAGGTAGTVFGRHFHRLRLLILVADAAALGIYGVVGTQKSMVAGLPVIPAMLIGVANAVGGGLLRDVLSREEPLLFKPGDFYALAALAGVVTFVAVAAGLGVAAERAAVAAIAVTFATRVLSIRLRWRTTVPEADADPGERTPPR